MTALGFAVGNRNFRAAKDPSPQSPGPYGIPPILAYSFPSRSRAGAPLPFHTHSHPATASSFEIPPPPHEARTVESGVEALTS
jgi:hypothetical protein